MNTGIHVVMAKPNVPFYFFIILTSSFCFYRPIWSFSVSLIRVTSQIVQVFDLCSLLVDVIVQVSSRLMMLS